MPPNARQQTDPMQLPQEQGQLFHLCYPTQGRKEKWPYRKSPIDSCYKGTIPIIIRASVPGRGMVFAA